MGKKKDFILELKNIKKLYPGVIALNNVTFNVERGEVHALLGENGAGKSTMIKICSGAIIPNEGEIVFDGKSYQKMTPEVAIKAGIAVIYQELNLVNALSVAENIFLGRAIKKGMFLDKKSMIEKSREIFEYLDIDIDPTAIVGSLTVGYQQMVELAKAISKDAKLIIMDEPSAALTKAETQKLYEVVDLLKSKGITVIYISHRLEDIFRLADNCTFLRDGEYIDTLPLKDCTEEKMISLMVGRELENKFPPAVEHKIGDDLLVLENVTGNGLYDINMSIKKGEILGIGGLIGAGRSELSELIFGVKPITSGSMLFRGKEYKPNFPSDAIEQGVGLVPEDRKQHGLILEEKISQNIGLPILKRKSKFGFFDYENEKKISEKYSSELQIKTPSIFQLVRNLSGGNQQKVVIGKWLASDAELIILDEPTRGIDVSVKYEIYKLMYELIDNGKTILMISSEMEELLGMCDRIVVLAEGHLTGVLNKNEFTQEAIMSLASQKGGNQ